MKKIVAIIRPDKLEEVKAALERIGSYGLTVKEVGGRGRQLGITESYRGHDYKVDLLPKTEIEIVTKEENIENIIETIISKAHTGDIGDGKVFISPIDEVIRIRTGESGEKAV
ncbi:MAG: P-II family nitrogen regulator [Methanobacterium sp.]|nr:P-II family nitrogen regulator [Methanobacterium sp.]